MEHFTHFLPVYASAADTDEPAKIEKKDTGNRQFFKRGLWN
jgi:hypothetical protein